MERYDLPADQLANEQEAGALRIASETDEKNCGCNDAAITPKNLYSLLDYRKASTAYTAGAIVACPYHKEFLLKCTTGGTTSANSIDTKSVTKGSVITDGGVKWTVIASQIIDIAISGKVITVTFVDGTQKTLTTQDTNVIKDMLRGASGYLELTNGFILAWTRSDIGTSKTVVNKPKAFNTMIAFITNYHTADGGVVAANGSIWLTSDSTTTTDTFKNYNSSMSHCTIWWIGRTDNV